MKKTLIISFAIVVLFQLAVPFKMMFDQEKILSTGIDYKFKITPVDPYDAFRGKYITLNFEKSSYTVLNKDSFVNDEPIFISLTTDSAGFADIAEITKTPPIKTDFVNAKVNYFYNGQLSFNYPFDKFFMEETKAPKAEKIYRESTRTDSLQEAYALVGVKDGEAALKDVIINGVSIKILAKQYEQKN